MLAVVMGAFPERPAVPTTTQLYWVAMRAAGTLGTAGDDFTLDIIGLGLFYGSAVLLVLLWRSWLFHGCSWAC